MAFDGCRCCELVDTHDIDDVDGIADVDGAAGLVEFNRAQRRALRQLDLLGIEWVGSSLRFLIRATARDESAVMGHADGVITLLLEEADPEFRERVRTDLNELYRTPLGHVRHELGHFVWMTLVAPSEERLADFRELFGDERADYRAALSEHYETTDDGSWGDEYLSFYATAHPWEDFAECWAHLLHVVDVVETAAAWDVIAAAPSRDDPDSWMNVAVHATLAANELSRSMGMRDLYPFVLSDRARQKLTYCWSLSTWAPVPAA